MTCTEGKVGHWLSKEHQTFTKRFHELHGMLACSASGNHQLTFQMTWEGHRTWYIQIYIQCTRAAKLGVLTAALFLFRGRFLLSLESSWAWRWCHFKPSYTTTFRLPCFSATCTQHLSLARTYLNQTSLCQNVRKAVPACNNPTMASITCIWF